MLILLFTTKWLLWMPGMTLMDFDDSSCDSFFAPSWSGYCLFSFLRSTVLPPAAQLFKECRGLQCHFYQRFCILNQCSSVFDNLPCSGINSHISKIMSIQSLVCWNEIRDVPFLEIFWKSSFLIKDPTHVIRNTQSFDCLVFWKQKSTRCRIKMAFSMVLCINLNPWY